VQRVPQPQVAQLGEGAAPLELGDQPQRLVFELAVGAAVLAQRRHRLPIRGGRPAGMSQRRYQLRRGRRDCHACHTQDSPADPRQNRDLGSGVAEKIS
jgi:hypothetical protein